MPDWKDLTFNVARTLQDLLVYMQQQPGGASAADLEKIREWLNVVQRIQMLYSQFGLSPAVSLEDRHIYDRLWAQWIDSVGTLRRGGSYYYIDVPGGGGQSALRGLDDFLGNFLSVGPHGPGKGPRIP
ncbi:MAG TPA: hypothetical protein VFA33_08825 [Bryobacteraceae bacterium]|jgi:hypothetical protein|nr:hypothetical protein [Bryobacteraceae bacterium]